MARQTTKRKTTRAKAKPAASKAKTTKRAAPKRATATAKAPARAPARKAAKVAPAAAIKSESTSQLVTLVSRLVARALSARLAPKGIGYGQLPVLLCLWQEDGLTQKELSQRVRIEAPTMVRTLDRMEREGLVTRVRSETDRRQIHIKLTTKGSGLQKSLVPLAAQVNTTALAGMTKKDQSQLNDSLIRLVQNLEKDASR